MTGPLEQQLHRYGEYFDQLLSETRPEEAAKRAVAGSVRLAGLPDSKPWWRTGWALATAGAAAVLFAIGGVALLLRYSADGVGENAALRSSMPIVLPTVAGGAATPEPIPADPRLGTGVLMSLSGDTLWAWDDAGQIAGHEDGTWRTLPTPPDHEPDAAGVCCRKTVDVAGSLDGTVWALVVTDPSTGGSIDPDSSLPEPAPSALWYLEDGVWSQPSLWITEDLDNIDLDPATGTAWMSSPGGALLSWDREGVVAGDWGASSLGMIFDEIAVTADGSVWVSRFSPLFPDLPAGLLRYRPETSSRGNGSWEFVHPDGGTVDAPTMLTATPTGNLWVLIADVEEWPAAEGPDREYPPAWILGFFDSASDDWTTYSVPAGHVGNLAGDDRTAWMTLSDDTAPGEDPRLIRFDRETWTIYQIPSPLDDLAIDGDGGIWVSLDGPGTLHRLVIEAGQDL
jgi:hypothetical protein